MGGEGEEESEEESEGEGDGGGVKPKITLAYTSPANLPPGWKLSEDLKFGGGGGGNLPPRWEFK